MKLLFIHKDFPGQYIHIIRHLADQGHQIVGIGEHPAAGTDRIRYIQYKFDVSVSPAHAFAQEFDLAVRNGETVARECERLKASGFIPDIVIGHTGWGETFFIKDVWPNVPLLGYFEFFYHATDSDVDFDAEFPPPSETVKRLRTRNAINLVALDASDWGQSPTRWQRARYPNCYHDRISVIHEGVDTDFFRPDDSARLLIAGGICLGGESKVITYAARSLEPYRGFHIFMRSLPEVLRRLPDAHVVIVGDDGVSYGRPPNNAENWRQQLLREVGDSLEFSRVHFLGHVNLRQYLTVLQISDVHVYLTYPFVLSWGLLNALSTGCMVVASDTDPVAEVIADGQNGSLVNFFDHDALARQVVSVIRAGRRASAHMRVAARLSIIRDFDLKQVCLPAYTSLLKQIISS